MQQNESGPDYNKQFDELYKKYQPKDVRVVEIARPNRIKEDTEPYQPIVSSEKSEEFLQQWLSEVELQQPGKARELKNMIADFTAAQIIEEYLTPGFVKNFEDLKNETDAFDDIRESVFIPSYFIVHSIRYIDLGAGKFPQPYNFKAMFTDLVLPKLLSKEIRGIKAEQATSKEKGVYGYDITLSNANLSLQLQAPGDRDLMIPFVWMVNRMLIATGITERFVRTIDAGDVSFGFFEPAKILPCLSKYGMRVGAMDIDS